jgi:hypothetical protein
MDDMKKALFISYVFPPMAAVGGHRIVNFCKFLPQFGWTPVVLTVKGGVNTSWDETPLGKIPGTIIYRSFTFEPIPMWEQRKSRSKEVFARPAEMSANERVPAGHSLLKRIKRFIKFALSVPDNAIFWVPFAVLKGIRVIYKEKISVIVSSSPPVSSHITASILSRLTGRPHIVDFRDLWTQNHNYDLRNYPGYVKRYDRFWEKMVLRKARWIVTASPGYSSQMESHLNGVLKGKVSTITNGFDYSEINLDTEFPRSEGKQLKFLYTGSLYGYFNPIFFLESLAGWIKKYNIDVERIKVDFFGNADYDYNDWARSQGLGKAVRFHGFRPQSELRVYFQETDYVLLLLGFRQEYKNVIPAKLFEYLASGAKILALTPDGIAAQLIRKYNAGVCINEPDKRMMIEKLNEIYLEWMKVPGICRKYRYIREIDRSLLVGSLANLLNQLTAGQVPN